MVILASRAEINVVKTIYLSPIFEYYSKRMRHTNQFNLRNVITQWLTVILVMFGGQRLAVSQEFSGYKDLEVKAVLIYKFLNFIVWPPKQNMNEIDRKAKKEITVGFFVDPQFYKACAIISGNLVNNRTIKTVQLSSADIDNPNLLNTCDVIFITQSANCSSGDVFPRLKGRWVLTFGETDDFLSYGGMIYFHTKNKKVTFDINLQKIHQSGFKVKAQLLKLARNVIQ